MSEKELFLVRIKENNVNNDSTVKAFLAKKDQEIFFTVPEKRKKGFSNITSGEIVRVLLNRAGDSFELESFQKDLVKHPKSVVDGVCARVVKDCLNFITSGTSPDKPFEKTNYNIDLVDNEKSVKVPFGTKCKEKLIEEIQKAVNGVPGNELRFPGSCGALVRFVEGKDGTDPIPGFLYEFWPDLKLGEPLPLEKNEIENNALFINMLKDIETVTPSKSILFVTPIYRNESDPVEIEKIFDKLKQTTATYQDGPLEWEYIKKGAPAQGKIVKREVSEYYHCTLEFAKDLEAKYGFRVTQFHSSTARNNFLEMPFVNKSSAFGLTGGNTVGSPDITKRIIIKEFPELENSQEQDL